MIFVRLKGGLGNQMFQYALGRNLAEMRKDTLCLETSLLNRQFATPREYGLSMFNIRATTTNMEEILRGSDVLFTIKQRKRGFHTNVIDCSYRGDIVLEGYWQNELYFKDIEHIIRGEFTFKPINHNAEYSYLDLRKQINSTNSVCMHIRRSDYLNTGCSNFFCIGVDYYKRAVSFIAASIQSPHFYLFSDDIDWCKQNIQIDYPHTFVGNNGLTAERAAEDFSLMTMCRHFILANSTFSWWAAWLSAEDKKVVVAPMKWFRDDHEASREIIPACWQRL